MSDQSNSPKLQLPTQGKAEKYFWCFISYRHADNSEKGREWASWLHRQLETYEVPEELVGITNESGRVIPERIYPVFRDEEELPAFADLSSAIIHALERSLSLVVICSPSSCESKFVNEEVLRYKAMGRTKYTCGMVIRGLPDLSSPGNCIPLPLARRVDARGTLSPILENPLLIDFRDETGGEEWIDFDLRYASIKSATNNSSEALSQAKLREERLQKSKLKVIAWVLGLPEETLRVAHEKREKRLRNKKRLGYLMWVFLILITLCGAYWGLKIAMGMQERTNISTGKTQEVQKTIDEIEKNAEQKKREALAIRLELKFKEGVELSQSMRWSEASEAFREASNGGHSLADYELALLYLDGRGVPVDKAEAIRLLDRAAAQGHAASHTVLGRLFVADTANPNNQEKVIKHFKEAIRLGDESGLLDLAKVLILKNPNEARNLIIRSVQSGNAEACWMMAQLLREEKSPLLVEGKNPEWYDWLVKASDKGWLPAKSEAGIAYFDGSIGPYNNRTWSETYPALRRLIEASAAGDVKATACVRNIYGDSKLYSINELNRLAFLLEGARAGVPQAMIDLAVYYSGIAQSYDDINGREANLWYDRAYKAGIGSSAKFKQAKWLLALSKKSSGVDAKKLTALATNTLTAITKEGDASAMIELAQLALENGNSDLAEKWYKDAESLDNKDARRALAALYIKKGNANQEASRLLKKGIEQHDGESALMLGDWMYSFAQNSQQLSQALNTYLAGAEFGNGRCAMKAASMIRKGKGAALDNFKANQLELKGAETGDAWCMLERARSLLREGTDRTSLIEAYAWLSLTSEVGLANESNALLKKLEELLTELDKREALIMRSNLRQKIRNFTALQVTVPKKERD